LIRSFPPDQNGQVQMICNSFEPAAKGKSAVLALQSFSMIHRVTVGQFCRLGNGKNKQLFKHTPPSIQCCHPVHANPTAVGAEKDSIETFKCDGVRAVSQLFCRMANYQWLSFRSGCRVANYQVK